ncbi:MAG: hypothetical protein P8188_07440 [Gemmatimonadota bacterium]|jgi:hypothetical protein
MRKLMCLGLVAAGSAMLLPVTASAQEPGPPRPAAEQRDSVDLRAEREVFDYPSFERRNPFKPLTGNEGGPRFEQMRLTGIILSDEAGRSVATLTAGGGTERTDTGNRDLRGRSARLRAGERWGNVRIVAIRQDRVIVDVEEFGLAERREMLLPTRGQGGSR